MPSAPSKIRAGSRKPAECNAVVRHSRAPRGALQAKNRVLTAGQTSGADYGLLLLLLFSNTTPAIAPPAATATPAIMAVV